MKKQPDFLRQLIGALLCLMLPISAITARAANSENALQAIADSRPYGYEQVLNGFTPGDSVSDWMAIAYGIAEAPIDRGSYLKKLSDYVTEQYRNNGGLHSVKATEWHRIALAITALGGDPACVGPDKIDLIRDGTYGWKQTDSLGTQGLNGWIFSLIVLDSKQYAVPEDARFTREDMLAAILESQEEDGGFGLSSGASDVDITAMALQAIAPYAEQAKEAVEQAVLWLSAQQQPTGQMQGWGQGNAESTAQTVIALTALGIDVKTDIRFCKEGCTLLDGLARFRLPDGLYCHTVGGAGDLMASQQAALAILSCEKAAKGCRLYDMKDIAPTVISRELNTKLWLIPVIAVAAAGIAVTIRIFLKKKGNAKCTK